MTVLQLRDASFQERLPEFEARGIRPVAISVDPPATTREHLAKTGWTYTFLSDPEGRGHPPLRPSSSGWRDRRGISRPAEFLIDPSGTVRWRDLTEDYWVRARPETVLGVFDELNGEG